MPSNELNFDKNTKIMGQISPIININENYL
jgi:hypothetical protein